MSLWFLQWEKRGQGGIQLPQCYGMLPRRPLGSCLLGIIEGICGAWLTTGGQTETEKGVRDYSNQCSDLGRLHSCLQWHLRRDPRRLLGQAGSSIYPGSLVISSAWFEYLANGDRLWSLFFSPSWERKQIYRPAYQLSRATSPAWLGSLATEPGQPGSLTERPIQPGNQTCIPSQLLSKACGPTQSGSLNNDPGHVLFFFSFRQLSTNILILWNEVHFKSYVWFKAHFWEVSHLSPLWELMGRWKEMASTELGLRRSKSSSGNGQGPRWAGRPDKPDMVLETVHTLSLWPCLIAEHSCGFTWPGILESDPAQPQIIVFRPTQLYETAGGPDQPTCLGLTLPNSGVQLVAYLIAKPSLWLYLTIRPYLAGLSEYRIQPEIPSG